MKWKSMQLKLLLHVCLLLHIFRCAMITCRLEYEIWHDDPLWVGNIIKCRPHPIQGGRASGGGAKIILSCLYACSNCWTYVYQIWYCNRSWEWGILLESGTPSAHSHRASAPATERGPVQCLNKQHNSNKNLSWCRQIRASRLEISQGHPT